MKLLLLYRLSLDWLLLLDWLPLKLLLLWLTLELLLSYWLLLLKLLLTYRLLLLKLLLTNGLLLLKLLLSLLLYSLHLLLLWWSSVSWLLVGRQTRHELRVSRLTWDTAMHGDTIPVHTRHGRTKLSLLSRVRISSLGISSRVTKPNWGHGGNVRIGITLR